jgi:hypothetical protein
MGIIAPLVQNILGLGCVTHQVSHTRSMMMIGTMPPAANILTNPRLKSALFEFVAECADQDQSRRADGV